MAAKRACGNGCTVRVWGTHRVAMRFILAQPYMGKQYPQRDRHRISAWIAVDGWPTGGR